MSARAELRIHPELFEPRFRAAPYFIGANLLEYERWLLSEYIDDLRTELGDSPKRVH